MRDLAPSIYRQRLVIEGHCVVHITNGQIKNYLVRLCGLLDMTQLTDPVTHKSPLYGWAGWMHWETSGVHFYAWDTDPAFFSVDIYACKKFDPSIAARFTEHYFNATEIVYKAVWV